MCTNVATNDETGKRKALELITNIFRKKCKDNVRDWREAENFPPTTIPKIESSHQRHHHHLGGDLASSSSLSLSADPTSGSSRLLGTSMHITKSCQFSHDYGIPPHSPVSPRVKNIDEDMEALTLSRQDNPFLTSKLEKLSTCGEFLSSSNLTIQQVQQGYHSQHQSPQANHFHSLITLDLEDLPGGEDSNLHEHLIRSPPPQFPQKLSHFVFPSPNSPMRNLSARISGSSIISPGRFSSQTKDENYLSNDSLALSIPLGKQHRRSIGTLGETGGKQDESLARRGSEGSSQPEPCGQPDTPAVAIKLQASVSSSSSSSSSNGINPELTKSPANTHSSSKPQSDATNYFPDSLRGSIIAGTADQDESSDCCHHYNDDEEDRETWNRSEVNVSNSREALLSNCSSSHVGLTN